MFALRQASRIIQANSTMAVARRTNVVIASPPRNKISFAEKMVHGVVIMVGCCSVPAWVLANIKAYRGRD